MAASSLTFTAPEPLTAATTGRRSRQTARAAIPALSVSLPLRFILTGLLSLFAGVGLLVARPDLLATYHYNQYVVAVTHLFVLGWICPVIMGALYQLAPVVLETRLYSEKLARRHFLFHLAGFVGMVWMFWVWNLEEVGHFGSVLAIGVGLFVYNLGRTLARLPRWNVVAGAIVSALCWLSATVLAGLFVACAKCWPISPLDPIAQMHAHAHLGGVGIFLLLIVGVSYKLVPMFALSEVQSPRRAWLSVWLLNGGLLGLVVTLALASRWKLFFAVVVLSGLAVYGCELLAIVRARKRRHLDWGLKYFLTAISLLGPLAVLAMILSWPGLPLTPLTGQLENVYGFLALIGVVSFAMLGLLYKVVPFLVWYASYSRQIGRAKVPALADLYSARLQAVGYWTFLAGVLAASLATAWANETAVRWSCALLAASLVLFATNMGRVLAHLVRPKIELPSCEPARAANLFS